METKSGWAPGLGVSVLGAERIEGHWIILALGEGCGVCPDRGKQSMRRHGWHERHLQDLPAQGVGVIVKLRMRRWRCHNKACERQTFVEQMHESSRLWRAGPGGPPNSFIRSAMALAAGPAND
jgi:hypothetical protein